MFDDSQSSITAVAFGLHKLNAWGFFPEGFEFLDFVNKATDFGFFHFHCAKLDTLADGDSANDIDDLFAIFDRSLLKLLKSAAGRRYGLVDIVEEPGVAQRSAACSGARCEGCSRVGRAVGRLRPDLADDLFDNGANEVFVDLHGRLLPFIDVVFFEADGIDDADDDAVDWKFAGFGGEPCRASLGDQN